MPEIKEALVTVYADKESLEKLAAALSPAKVNYCLPYGPGAQEKIREACAWSASDGTTVYLYYYSSDAFAIMYVSPELGSRVYQTNGL